MNYSNKTKIAVNWVGYSISYHCLYIKISPIVRDEEPAFYAINKNKTKQMSINFDSNYSLTCVLKKIQYKQYIIYIWMPLSLVCKKRLLTKVFQKLR